MAQRLTANFCKMWKKTRKWWYEMRGTETLLYTLLVALSILYAYLFGLWLEWPEGNYLDLAILVGTFSSAAYLILIIILLYRRLRTLEESTGEHATENRQQLFSTAVNQLGSSTDSVRLGGIHALCELAKEDQYRENVHEILCSHVRNKTNETEYKKQYKNRPSAEIQSLIDLLVKPENHVFQGLPVNFEKARLQGAALDRARLQKANLARAQLQGATLEGAQLHGANFLETQLQGAFLLQAQLQGSYLVRSQLQGVYLVEAQLQETFFLEAQLQGAELVKTQLQGAYLGGAQLQGASLQEAQLQGAYLEKTQLQEADFEGAQLQGAFSSLPHPVGFQAIITSRINQDTEPDHAVLKGINAPGFAEIRKGLNLGASHWDFDERQRLQELLNRLRTHLNKPDIPDEKKTQFLEARGAETGSYDKGYADKLIAEYEKTVPHEKD